MMGSMMKYRRPGSLLVPEVEDLFRNFFDTVSSSREFPVEIFEEKGELVLVVDAPGVAVDKVEIRTFPDRVLVKAAEDAVEEEPEGRTYYCRRRRTALNYNIALPVEINPDQVRASVKNGLITVRLPRKGREEGRVVALQEE